jgi:hypothetical protein
MQVELQSIASNFLKDTKGMFFDPLEEEVILSFNPIDYTT